jgi:hypothetical protein
MTEIIQSSILQNRPPTTTDGLTASGIPIGKGWLDTTTSLEYVQVADGVWLSKFQSSETGADGISAPLNLSLFKSTSNGIVSPQLFKWISNLTVSSVQLMSNCADISVTIGTTTYNHTTLVGVALSSGTQLTINDITVVAGQTNANAIIIFTQS